MNKKRITATSIVLLIFLLYACAVNLAELIVITPIQAKNIVDQGLSGLSHLAASDRDIQKMNEISESLPTIVTVEDTYRYAYGKELSEAPLDGETGQEFHNMREASHYLQQILKAEGETRPEDYILTSVNTAREEGFTLLAVVKRPDRSITIADSYNQESQRNVGPQDIEFYQPARGYTGREMHDTVVDWAGFSNDYLAEQGNQAVLLTTASNQILNHERKEGFWEGEKRWVNGDYIKVLEEQERKICMVRGSCEGAFNG